MYTKEVVVGIKAQSSSSFITTNEFEDITLVKLTRPECETDTRFKHFATYSIIQDIEGRIFTYKRNKKASETRLTDRYSIGVGGHVRFLTSSLVENIIRTTHREILEELYSYEDSSNSSEVLHDHIYSEYISSQEGQIITYIYSDVDEVSQRHIGAITRVVLSPKDIEVLKPSEEVSDYEWLTLSEIRERASKDMELESWSKMLIESFESLPGNKVISATNYGEAPFNEEVDIDFDNSN